MYGVVDQSKNDQPTDKDLHIHPTHKRFFTQSRCPAISSRHIHAVLEKLGMLIHTSKISKLNLMDQLSTCSSTCGSHITIRPRARCILQNLKPTPTAEFFVSDRPSKHTSQRNEAFSYALDRQEDKARKLREVHTVMIPSLVKEQEQLRKALKPLKAGVGGLSAGLEDFKAMEKLVDAKTLLRNKGM